ncbi:MAG: DUF5663 domain-containing protein [Syntrophales bacterium]
MEDLRNPYILNFFNSLIQQKDLKLSSEGLSKMIEDMYRLFENMLGKNMVAALPADAKSEYLAQHEKEGVDFDKIGQIFGEHIPKPDEILKDTMKQFAATFSKNR